MGEFRPGYGRPWFRGVIADDPDVLVFYAQGSFDGEDEPHVYEVDEATDWLLDRGFGRPQFGITADRRTWVVVAPWPSTCWAPPSRTSSAGT